MIEHLKAGGQTSTFPRDREGWRQSIPQFCVVTNKLRPPQALAELVRRLYDHVKVLSNKKFTRE
jgi:hypothetical protein